MRKKYIDTINEIEKRMVDMALLAEKSLDKTMDSLMKRDIEKSKIIIEDDVEIDNMEIEIEKSIVKLLTLENPKARDFRRVASVFKIITDLERIGDLAADIAEISIGIGDEDFIKPLIDLPRMYEITKEMLSSSIKAYKRNDKNLALEISKKDDLVDDLHFQINEELIHMLSNDIDLKDQAMKLMYISRYLERIADHVTNICERIIYIETNKITS